MLRVEENIKATGSLSRAQVDRVRSYALRKWEFNPFAPATELARGASRSVVQVSLNGPVERANPVAQTTYFSVLAVVSAARVAFLRARGLQETVDRLRALVGKL